MTDYSMTRRDFVGKAALGTGFIAALSSVRAFGSGFTELVPTLKNVWTQAGEYTMEFARAMPAEKFGFKPTEEVFSFAEQLLHLAGANFWFFSTIKGEKIPKSEEDLESEGKNKADVVALLAESFRYGDAVVENLTDAAAANKVTMGENTLLCWKLIFFNVDHITHHRGQMVAYLRLNGIKPPQYRSGFYG